MLYPPSANNFDDPMPCRPSCRTFEASFLEDLDPPSKLVCHIPHSGNNFEHLMPCRPLLYLLCHPLMSALINGVIINVNSSQLAKMKKSIPDMSLP